MNLVTRLLVAAAILAMPLAGQAEDFSTQTDVKHDINGATVSKKRGVKGVRWNLANGAIVLTVPNDEWALNRTPVVAGTPEWWSSARQARVGVWAAVDQSGWTPNRAVTDWVASMKTKVGGTWTEPTAGTVAGVPVVKATGNDVFGNYWYEVYAVARPQMQYLVYVRTPYENRWNTALHSDVAWFISHVHPSTTQVMTQLEEDRKP